MKFNKLKSIVLYPARAVCSIRFYFEVLFAMRGAGISYLLALSLIVAVPVTFRANSVLDAFEEADLPSMIAAIPRCYIDYNGNLVVNDESESLKHIMSKDGVIEILFNPSDETVQRKGAPFSVELRSDHFNLNIMGNSLTESYLTRFEKGSSFDPVLQASVVGRVIHMAKYLFYFVMTVIVLIKMAFISCIAALIAKMMFLFAGKMKTSFINVMRLTSFACTLSALLFMIKVSLLIEIPDIVLMMIPVLYMALFIRQFRRELESEGVEAFVKQFAPKGTSIHTSPLPKSRKDLEQNNGTDTDNSEDNKSDDGNHHDKGSGRGSFSA